MCTSEGMMEREEIRRKVSRQGRSDRGENMMIAENRRRDSLASAAVSLLWLWLLSPSVTCAWSGRVSPAPALPGRPSFRMGSPPRATALAATPRLPDGEASTRRSFLVKQTASILATTAVLSGSGARASLAADDDLVDVYFGCGCFWHVQHEFVEAERNILGRSDSEITSRAGYAGGKAGSVGGKVCYHNAQNVADYGKLGHAEVVSMKIPTSKFEDFAVEYCKLFDKEGFRPDQFGDRGTEYRNLVGIPGGKSSPLAEILVKASVATGDKLDFAVGKGDDKDLPKVSFIMDTADYPFYVAEEYHQFHDGFKLDENYPNYSYNSLAGKFVQKGESFGSCPNGMMGLGIGGL